MKPMRKFSELQLLRHKNLRAIIESKGRGAQKQLSVLLGQDSTYTNQFATKRPSRPISDDMARKIEAAYKLPKFSLDNQGVKQATTSSIDIQRMTLAVKYAQRAVGFIDGDFSSEQLARIIADLYEGSAITTAPTTAETPEKQAMISAGVLAHELIQKVKNEPGVKMTDEEERETYAELLNDIFTDLNGKTNNSNFQSKHK